MKTEERGWWRSEGDGKKREMEEREREETWSVGRVVKAFRGASLDGACHEAGWLVHVL